MKTVADIECERMFTFELVMENRLGKQRTFTEAMNFTHHNDGSKTVAYHPESETETAPTHEQKTERFGLDWKVVEVTGTNVPREEQSI